MSKTDTENGAMSVVSGWSSLRLYLCHQMHKSVLCFSCASSALPSAHTLCWCLCSCEVLLQSGERVAGACKRLPYHTQQERAAANAELAGLQDAEGCPHIVQCYGAFQHRCLASSKQYIFIVME